MVFKPTLRCMGKGWKKTHRPPYKTLIGRPHGKKTFGRQKPRKMITLMWILKRSWTGSG